MAAAGSGSPTGAHSSLTLVRKASGSAVGWNCCPGHDVAGVGVHEAVLGRVELVDGVVPIDTDVAVSDEVAVATNTVKLQTEFRTGRSTELGGCFRL